MYLILALITLFVPLYGSIDLEEYCQDFVLQTKKIDVPGYPHAFNPSIIRWNNKLLMSFRIITRTKIEPISSFSSDSQMGLIWLDDDFNPDSPPQILDCENTSPEDGRLIEIDGRIYMIYSGKGFHIYIAELSFDGFQFHVIHNERLVFEGSNPNHREKNWVPFVCNDHLHLAYQLYPYTILAPALDGTGVCETISHSKPSIVWEWGELRGGTPALKLNETTYIAFFHSSTLLETLHSHGEAIPHYFMGAYTFSNDPTFQMQQISPEPIVSRLFYSGADYKPYWHPVRVVFPCGILMEERFIWVTYGRQDHECWVVKIEKQGLLESLIQVSTTTLD